MTPSDHCDGRRFFLPGAPALPSFWDLLKWRRSRQESVWPDEVEVSPQAPAAAPSDSGGLALTWINHASFLLRTSQSNLLIDPVYSKKIGPFGLVGPTRVHAPGVPFDSLPKIDTVLVSHDHYDHCDLPTLRMIAERDQPVAIVPLANVGLMKRAGFQRVVELDWWEKHIVGLDGEVTLTPSQHWSNRLSGHRCGRLWGGFYLRLAQRTLYFVGDTGYHPKLFAEIRQRLGSPDIALIPIGAFEPRWFMRNQHCNPAEALQICADVDAGIGVAMHWGTFQLTDEARTDPPAALAQALDAPGGGSLDFRILQPGESLVV